MLEKIKQRWQKWGFIKKALACIVGFFLFACVKNLILYGEFNTPQEVVQQWEEEKLQKQAEKEHEKELQRQKELANHLEAAVVFDGILNRTQELINKSYEIDKLFDAVTKSNLSIYEKYNGYTNLRAKYRELFDPIKKLRAPRGLNKEMANKYDEMMKAFHDLTITKAVICKDLAEAYDTRTPLSGSQNALIQQQLSSCKNNINVIEKTILQQHAEIKATLQAKEEG